MITKTKTYVVVKDIKFDNLSLPAGTKIDVTTDEKNNTTYAVDNKNCLGNAQLAALFVLVNINNTSFFKPIYDCPFEVGQTVYRIKSPASILVVKEVDYIKNACVVVPDGTTDDKTITTTYKYSDLKPVSPFWFINTDGRICKEYPTRKPVKYQVAVVMGNYYESYEECKRIYEKMEIEKKRIFN